MLAENYQLVVRRGPKPGQIYPLLAPTITIGRDPMSDISLNDPEISRYHAQLIQTDTGYQIQDMGSTNGTYVAGQRLAGEPVLLSPGVEVAFGSGITLTYELTGGDEGGATIVDYGAALQPKPETAVPEMSSPPPPPSYAPEPAQPLIPGADDGSKKKRTTRIVIAVVLILLLCCCGFIAFMWFYGGDWILQQLDLAMITPVVQSLLA